MFKKQLLTTGMILNCMLAIALLSGCNKSDVEKPTQVAAKVDGKEISVHQINQVLKSAKNVSPENAPKVKQEILEKLIDQQIILARAEKENLDRTPEVVLAIEAARRDIIARAYLQKLVSDSVKITDQDVKTYYDEHPGLFAKRRIYNLQDIALEAGVDVSAFLNDEFVKQKSMQEIAESLKAKGIKFSGGSYARPAEQIPLDVLPKLQDVKDGETKVLPIGSSLHVIHLTKSQPAPIDMATASPFIKNYFMNIRGKKVEEEQVARFRKEAKVVYTGEFVAPETSTTREAPNDSVRQSDSKAAVDPAIEQGVAGLK